MNRIKQWWIVLFSLSLPGMVFAEREAEPYLLVASAFAGELEAVLEAIEEEVILEVERVNGIEFLIGEAYGLPVIFFETQVGMTNAAMNTQLALSRYPVEAVLFSGIAGGINPELETGDVVVPRRWHYHDYGGYFNPEDQGGEGYPEGVEIYGYRYGFEYGNFEMFLPAKVPAMREGLEEAIRVPEFEADAEWLALAEAAAGELILKDAYGETAEIALGGVGGSGNIFMDNAAFRVFMRETWGSDSVDMESTAVAQVCWSNRVPFLIVRSLSDLAGAQHGENEMPKYMDNAWSNAGRLVAAILEMKAEGRLKKEEGGE